MKDQRPINLNLLTIRFPITAIVSILHRLSGVVLFLLIPLMIWAFGMSLSSQHEFDDVHQFLASPLSKIVIWLFLSAFIYHFVAGIRHLLMDVSIGDTLQGGKMGSKLVLIISIVLILLAGFWIW